jgi:hypothetical protein
MMANLLFAAAFSQATLLKTAQVPDAYVLIVLGSAVLIAFISNFVWLRLTGLVGLAGLSFVYSRLFDQNNPGAWLTLIVAGLCITGVILLMFADLDSKPKGEEIHSNEAA